MVEHYEDNGTAMVRMPEDEFNRIFATNRRIRNDLAKQRSGIPGTHSVYTVTRIENKTFRPVFSDTVKEEANRHGKANITGEDINGYETTITVPSDFADTPVEVVAQFQTDCATLFADWKLSLAGWRTTRYSGRTRFTSRIESEPLSEAVTITQDFMKGIWIIVIRTIDYPVIPYEYKPVIQRRK